jgi:hypothetical protein
MLEAGRWLVVRRPTTVYKVVEEGVYCITLSFINTYNFSTKKVKNIHAGK